MKRRAATPVGPVGWGQSLGCVASGFSLGGAGVDPVKGRSHGTTVSSNRIDHRVVSLFEAREIQNLQRSDLIVATYGPEHRALCAQLADLDAKLKQAKPGRARAPLTIHRVAIAPPSADGGHRHGAHPWATSGKNNPFSSRGDPYPQSYDLERAPGPVLSVTFSGFDKVDRKAGGCYLSL